MSESKCFCGKPATNECNNCKIKLCDDIDCGQITEDGYLCGLYTQWGCGKKYTTCDSCLDDKAIHESNLNFCEECGDGFCDSCVEDNSLENHDCSG